MEVRPRCRPPHKSQQVLRHSSGHRRICPRLMTLVSGKDQIKSQSRCCNNEGPHRPRPWSSTKFLAGFPKGPLKARRVFKVSKANNKACSMARDFSPDQGHKDSLTDSLLHPQVLPGLAQAMDPCPPSHMARLLHHLSWAEISLLWRHFR